jgi:HD-like signal output (HDOD) protein
MNCAPHVPAFALTRETILLHARTLPAAPQVLGGLCELLADANTDLDRIAAEIRLEPTLASRVIRISNSAAFGNGQRIGSVDEAVSRVGFGEVLGLVGAATVAGVADRALGCYGVAVDRLREAMLFHALASEALAVRAGLDSRQAYAGGLLRSIGMMVIDHGARLLLPPAERYQVERYARYQDWEEEKFGLGGVDATALVLGEWQFPPELVAAVREHLLTREASDQDRFAVVLHLAGCITAERGLALPGEVAHWVFTPAKLEAAGLEESQFIKAANQATASFERQRSALY